MVKFYILK